MPGGIEVGRLFAALDLDDKRFTSKLDSVQASMRKTGAVMSAAITPPLLLLGNAAADAASDLGESVNAVNVVFGQAADKIHAFAQIAADEAGLSMRALNELVTPVGASLQNVGFSADQAADASINLATRAADMASVFNVDVAEAMAAIQSGLNAQSEPLRRFGVDLSDAAVRAHAVELGLAASASEVDKNSLAQARLSLLMEQTDKLAGDFKNTSDQLANSQRINAAEAENVSASYGEKLLPAKKAIADAIARLLELFGNLSPEMQTAVIAIAAVAAAIGPLLLIGSSLISVVRGIGAALLFASANPIVLIIAAIAALVVGLVYLWNTSEDFRRIVTDVFNTVGRVVGDVVGGITGAFDGMGKGIGKAWDGVVRTVRGAINWVIDIVNGFIRHLNSIQIHIPGFETPLGTIARFDWWGLGLRTIPKLDTGMWNVPAPMVAMIHRGEAVLPADEAERYRAGRAGFGEGYGGRGGPLIGEQHIYGTQPGDVERETKRAFRRAALAWRLEGY